MAEKFGAASGEQTCQSPARVSLPVVRLNSAARGKYFLGSGPKIFGTTSPRVLPAVA
jgi:hypothetical protein